MVRLSRARISFCKGSHLAGEAATSRSPATRPLSCAAHTFVPIYFGFVSTLCTA